MSGRGRRRRRRRGPAQTGGGQPSQKPTSEAQPKPRRSRRRRGRRGSGEGTQVSSPKSSEDLVRALPRERPASLTSEPDGTTAEQVIGELQSEWGVPQYPQEYRITLKVAEERDGRAEKVVSADDAVKEAAEESQAPAVDGGPRREKAPSLRSATGSGPAREAAPKRRRRGGRRRRRRGGTNPT
jgi:hypothetical protein